MFGFRIATISVLVCWLGLPLVGTAVHAQQPSAPITALLFDDQRVIGASQAGFTVLPWSCPANRQSFPPVKDVSHIHHLLRAQDGEALLAVGGTPQIEGSLLWLDPADFTVRRRVLLGEDVLYDACWLAVPGVEAAAMPRLAVAGPGTQVHIVGADADSPRALTGHSRTVLCVEYLGGSAWPLLLSAGRDATIRVWDAETFERVRTLDNHTAAVVDLAARPRGPATDPETLPLLASAGADQTVRFWQPTIGRLVRFARLDSAPLQIAWSPDGQTLWASCEDGDLRAVDVQTVDVQRVPTRRMSWAYSLVLESSGNTAVVGGAGGIEVVPIGP